MVEPRTVEFTGAELAQVRLALEARAAETKRYLTSYAPDAHDHVADCATCRAREEERERGRAALRERLQLLDDCLAKTESSVERSR